MALTNAERQQIYRQRQKEKNGNVFLERERNRKKKAYIPSNELSASDKKERNLKRKLSNRKYKSKDESETKGRNTESQVQLSR